MLVGLELNERTALKALHRIRFEATARFIRWRGSFVVRLAPSQNEESCETSTSGSSSRDIYFIRSHHSQSWMDGWIELTGVGVREGR